MRYIEGIVELKKKPVGRFMLTGPEQFLKENFVKVARSLGGDYLGLWSDEVKEALSNLRTIPLFDGRRTIALFDFDKMKPDQFVDAIKRASSDTIIMLLGEKADLKTRAMTEIVSISTVVTCEKLRDYGADYPKWISSLITESGYTIESGVEALLFYRIGPDMFTLSREIEKLFLMCKGKHITSEDVSRYVSMTSRATAFDLLDAMLRKDVGAALRCLSTYRESEHELVKFLGNYMEKMYRIALLREEGFELDIIADVIGIHKYLVSTRYLPRVIPLGKKFFADKLHRLCELDARMRTFRGDEGILIQQFVYSFVR